MNKSLYTKLILIIFVLILSLMIVVGAFLLRGIRAFYQNEFYRQMDQVFSNEKTVQDLRDKAKEDSPAEMMAEVLIAHSGELGIDTGTRNYYILSKETGALLLASDDSQNELPITENIITAMNGKVGDQSDPRAGFMDVALPISGSGGGFIVYIRDNKQVATDLSAEIFKIIAQSMAIGIVISVVLSLILARAMVTPVQNLTRAARRVAGGDFTEALETQSRDEIGVLTNTFNDMAGQLQRTLDDLRRSEQMRREFVANVSHELRTPVTSIRSYAETLRESEEIAPKTSDEFLDVIINESDRMTKLVQDLLTLSKFDAGAAEFRFDEFSLKKSLTSVYNAMAMEAQRRCHEFTLDIKEPLPDIYGDRARLEQVFINLISNAFKYTHDGGKIRFSAGQNRSGVWIRVKDNGVGIPEADLPRVFERFYRVDKARSREFGGTGLGLSIASEIIAYHGGEIKLESSVGVGTTVTLILPLKPQVSAEADPQEPEVHQNV